MIVIKIELVPGGIGPPKEIGRMVICNDGSGDVDIGNYNVYLGRKGTTSSHGITKKPQRKGKVENHRRLTLPVWSLVAKCLASVGFKAGKQEETPLTKP